MSNCLSPSQLRALAFHDVALSEIDGAEAHLRDCDDCRRRLAEFQTDREVTPASQDALTATAPRDRAARSPAPVGDHPPAADIPGYSRLEFIGRGGQGMVYSAVQNSTKRRVALKVLAASASSPAHRARFKREVETLASIAHPAIVTVFDSGTAGDKDFYSMEYIRGRPVTAYLRATHPAVREILALFAEIAAAVGIAHARGIVHRDLKPTNILVDDAGHPHVLDFGLAKDVGPGSAVLQVTDTGEFVGTLAYAAPEQRRAAHLDANDPLLVDPDKYSSPHRVPVSIDLLFGDDREPPDCAENPFPGAPTPDAFVLWQSKSAYSVQVTVAASFPPSFILSAWNDGDKLLGCWNAQSGKLEFSAASNEKIYVVAEFPNDEHGTMELDFTWGGAAKP